MGISFLQNQMARDLALTTGLVVRIWCPHLCNLDSTSGGNWSPTSGSCRPRPPKTPGCAQCVRLCGRFLWCGVYAQSCLTLCDAMDYSLPGSSVHGIFQARILKRVAISYSKKSSWSRNWTCVSCIDRQIVYHWATWEARRSLPATRPAGALILELLASRIMKNKCLPFISHSVSGVLLEQPKWTNTCRSE